MSDEDLLDEVRTLALDNATAAKLLGILAAHELLTPTRLRSAMETLVACDEADSIDWRM